MSDYDRLLHLVRQRRSPYAFDGTPVSDDDLRRVFEAGRWAPSSYNEQPWRFVVGRRGDAAYQAIYESLTGRNPEWTRTAPVLGLVVVSETLARSGTPNRHRWYDAGAAMMAASLAAEARGLGVHQMAGVDAVAAGDALGVPDGFEVVAAFALGRPTDNPGAVLPDDLAERARNRKPRRPLAETVFGSTWDDALLAAS